MIYRYDVRRNRKIYVLYGGIAALAAGAAAAVAFIPGIAGLVVMALLGYLAYQLFKFVRNQTSSYIHTHDDGITAHTGVGGKTHYTWDEITHRGVASAEGRRAVFFYSESTDRLLSIPDEFFHFDDLVEEVKALGNATLVEMDSVDHDTIKKRLQTIVGVTRPQEDSEETPLEADDASDVSDVDSQTNA